MKVAALDLGSNTFILLIAEVSEGQITKVIHDEVRIVRLGQGVHESRRFHPDALKRADEAFASFSKTIAKHDVKRVLACATSAARDVKNGNDLIELAARYKIPVDIISGNQEAEATFQGTVSGLTPGPVFIIDVGGGSTEVIVGDARGLIARKSLDIGSVRLTEMFVTGHPISTDELQKMTSYIQTQLRSAREELGAEIPRDAQMIAVAGTPTTLATIDQGLPFETERVDGFVIPLNRISYWVQKLSSMTVEERQKLAGMEPKRADVIVAGSMILILCAQAFGAKELKVSIRGLRYGVALSLGQQTN